MDLDLKHIAKALERNPQDRVSVLALRDWLEERGGDGSPLLKEGVWILLHYPTASSDFQMNAFTSRMVAMSAAVMVLYQWTYQSEYPEQAALIRKVRNDEEVVEWEMGEARMSVFRQQVLHKLE